MAQISAALVKELRERTGSGMMECKKALTETNGDLEAAIEHLRKTGAAKADKKAGRTAAEGAIVIRQDGAKVAMVEVNCETDFVAKGDRFQGFAGAVAALALAEAPADLDALLALPLEGGKTVADTQRDLIVEIGEKIEVRRFFGLAGAGVVAHYLHGSRIGVVVELQGGEEALARDIAMHVAAANPLCASADQVPPEILDKEREIARAQAQESGKPDNVIDKMVEGKVAKFVKENTLLGQVFVKDPEGKQTVEKLLKAHGASLTTYRRLELGEGIEKKAENFVEEVMAQARSKT